MDPGAATQQKHDVVSLDRKVWCPLLTTDLVRITD
jgi:hypothetical protein